MKKQLSIMIKSILGIKMSTSAILTLIALLLCSLTFTSHAALPTTSEGWTIFTPSEDSLIVYVSNAGNDETAKTYAKKELGSSPFNPPENMTLHSFKTFKAAFEKTRKNKPDWILVKRGDTFFESIKVRDGKSLTEPFLVAAYGVKKSNPIFNTGDKIALRTSHKSFKFIAVQGLDFYAHTRIPNSTYYISPKGSYGLGVYIEDNHLGNGLLIEGNRFNFYTNNVVQGPGTLKNIVIRRNSFFDSYSTTSHSQGLYAANVSLKLEENIFDHNGWLVQADKENRKEQGAATMFNHNTYFADTNDVEFINNIFIRSASIHNKWTSNKGTHSSSDIIIKNNLYVDGEIGISAGGNKAGAYRFKNYQITDNVMLNIGRSQPTGRKLGWGLEIKDWDGGIVKNNYFLNQVNPQVTNTYGIKISGTTKNVEIENNKFDNLFSANAIVLGTGRKANIAINNNQFSFKANGEALITVENDLAGYSFKNNHYFHGAGPQRTYLDNTSSVSFWQTIFPPPKNTNFLEWITLTKEQESQWHKPNALERRTIVTYQKSIHKKATVNAFIQEMRNMKMMNWDSQYTAASINNYIKLGYNKI
jgi:hypothetical protein